MDKKIQHGDVFKLIVMVSGNGSNLQAIINAIETGQLHAEIVAIITNKTKAYALERARKHAIPAYVIPSLKALSRDEYDIELADVIARIDKMHGVDLIVLAGFMRIFSQAFVERFQGKIINIHPSLLPKYRGLNTHQKALDAKDQEHGSSIHFVTPELDGGPVISQAKVTIDEHDTVASLSAKVQVQEHKMYPFIIQWFSENRIKLLGDQVIFDEEVLLSPKQMC